MSLARAPKGVGGWLGQSGLLVPKVAVGVPCPWGDTAAYPTGLRGEKTAFLVEVTPL